MHLFGWAYSHHNAHYRRIIETMDAMAAETGETVQLCGLRGNKYVGARLPQLAGTVPHFERRRRRGSDSIGVGPAAARPHERRRSAFVPADDYRLPDGRVVAEADFLADNAKARKQGFSETAALADRFTWCMAAPLRDRAGAITRTLCFVLPIDTPESRRTELLSLLRERALSLSLEGN